MNGRQTAIAGLALCCVAALAAEATAQGFSTFGNLPSEKLMRDFGSFSTGRQYTSRGTGGRPSGPLAARFGVRPGEVGGRYGPRRFDFSAIRQDLAGLRLRTLESFALGRRARFAGLQRLSLELGGMVGGDQLAGISDPRRAFYQFIFPFGLREKPERYPYGYYCKECLSEGHISDPDRFLQAFSREAQETISAEGFKKALASLLRTGELPEGQTLDSFYDTQLAAMGNYLFSNGRYAAAAEAWSVLAKRDPTSSLFAQARGQSLFAARRFEEAGAALRRSLRRAPKWGTDEFRIGGVNLQNIYGKPEDLAEARLNLEPLLRGETVAGDVRFLMAYVDLFHGLWDRARAQLSRLADRGDAEGRGLLETLEAGRVDATVRRPMVSDRVITAGDVAEMEEDVMLSLEERKAMADAVLHPDSYKDYMTRGDYYFFMANYARASESYSEAGKLQPDDAIPLFARAHASVAGGEFKYAARLLRKALEMEPDWGLYDFQLEEFFGDRKDLDKRIGDLRHLVKLRPGDNGLKFLLGYVYYFDDRFDDAARLLSDAVLDAPGYEAADPLLKLARLQS